jgi:hypothetical protein
MRRLYWIIIFLPIAACHYNDGLGRVAVRGNVTYDGAPVKHGMITFRPVLGSNGPSAGTAIIDGKFQITAEKGPTVGPHEVAIKIADLAKDATKSDEPAVALREAIHFKSFSQKVSVERQANEFNFEFAADSQALKSNPK